MKKAISIRFDVDLLESAKKIAATNNITLTELIEHSIRAYIQPYIQTNETNQTYIQEPKETYIQQTEPQTEPKTPAIKPNQSIQSIKNQPIRAYKPKPNPNKALFDKLNH